MFTPLSDRLTETFKSLRGKGKLSESDVNQALRDIRLALHDAHVPLPRRTASPDQPRRAPASRLPAVGPQRRPSFGLCVGYTPRPLARRLDSCPGHETFADFIVYMTHHSTR